MNFKRPLPPVRAGSLSRLAAPSASVRRKGRPKAIRAVNVNLTPNSKPQNEPSVAIRNHIVLATANDYRAPDGEPRIGVYRSTDGGRRFTNRLLPLPPDHAFSGDGVAAAGRRGLFLITGAAYLGEEKGSIVLYRSEDNGATFSGPQILDLGRTSPSVFNDKPFLAITPATSRRFRNHAYVAYSRYTRNSTRVSIFLVRSEDNGRTWSKPMRLTPALDANQLGTTVAIGPEGEVYVGWMASRNDFSRSATYEFRSSFDGGRTFTPRKRVSAVVPVLNRKLPVKSFTFRVFTLSFLGVDRSHGPHCGRLYAVWQDTRFNGNAHILLSVSDDKGASWSKPKRIDNSPLSSQNFFPFIAVSRSGEISVVYYTNRRAANLLDVYVAQSNNGGRCFRNRRVTTVSFNPVRKSAFRPPFIGDYIGVDYKPDGQIFAVWCDNRRGNEDIFGGGPD
ncbi:sialidase family protein [Paenibacillus aurantius]|uniref:Sialidase family protein n=1 Tax=Paenibacillus aurantius TaxID=2918900 RepID=A0AA96RGR6_9BACL|nr:sialidase family protein [Paenibacillus aurantius]WNQ12776.1 sialidase family protein [Paenibacillus aurantius]